MTTKSELIIKTKIRERGTVELIDYLNPETRKTEETINTSGVLRRNKRDVYFVSGDNLEKTEFDLINIKKNNITGRYIIDCGKWSKDLTKLVDEPGIFMVYRGMTLKDINKVKNERYYKLKPGDIFKIGRVYVKVLEINIKKNSSKNKNNNKSIKNNILQSSNSSRFIINNQQIIKGAFTPKYGNKNRSQIIFNQNNNYNNNYYINNSVLASHIKKKNFIESFELSKNNKMPFLPRINSSNELFCIKKINQKNKKFKIPKDLVLKKTSLKHHSKPSCRICYGEQSSVENPLICPCICKGSMKYIHYECLKSWLNSKIEEELSEDSTEKDIKDYECITYSRKDISCELCKEKFPDYIIHNNIYYNILFYKPHFEEYIILESLRVGRDKNKYYHVITLDNRDFINIGRANECELSLPEVSVSRFHCLIHKENEELYLEDNTSKFGTLVLVQNERMIMNDYFPLRIQVNRTYVKFRLNLPFSFGLNCCGRQDTEEYRRYDYQVQNEKYLDVLSFFNIKDDNDVADENDDNFDDTATNNGKDLIDKDDTKANINNINNDINKESIKNNKKELIDKESLNKSSNKNIIKIGKIEEEKNNEIKNNINKEEKISLIDKSDIVDNKNNINESIDNENENHDIVEIESEFKNEVLNSKLSNNNNTLKKNEIKISKKPNTTRIKKISLKKGKTDKNETIKKGPIKSSEIKDNISISLLVEKNKNKNFHNINNIYVDSPKNWINNTTKNKSIFGQTGSHIKIKNHNSPLNGLMGNFFDTINKNEDIKEKK